MSSTQGNEIGTTSRRPKDTKFKQQKLPAWQPILTANTVLPAFFALGVAFIPLGVLLFVTSESIKEFTYDYTDCFSTTASSSKCADLISPWNTSSACVCRHTFTLDSEYGANVYLFYGLTNFYQNHRRYVRSRDDNQLKGDVLSPGSLNSDCDPYRLANDSVGYAPCGAIANSLFNDTFTITYHGVDGKSNVSVPLLSSGIAWTSDKNVKFGNPSDWQKSKYTHPPNWNIDIWDFGSGDNMGYKNEDFIVWMRTAALPTFRKLHRRIDHSQTNFKTGLPAGQYRVEINYAYPVTQFEGTKRFILSNTSFMGGKNSFLGIAYMVVGCICVLLGVVFLIVHLQFAKSRKTKTRFQASVASYEAAPARAVEMTNVTARDAF